MNLTETQSGFAALHVAPALCKTLELGGITIPTPIQAQAIPLGMDGHDLIGIAQTGTGKTLAFGLPMAARLQEGQVGLILAPTRELAQQIAETYLKLNMRCTLVVGGASMHLQVKSLRGNPTVIVATPGRLLDHLERGTVRLGRVSMVVLDEADRMLDMGFAPAIKRILDRVPENRQTLLFSATMPKEITELANSYLKNPHRIEVSPSGSTPELVEQEVIFLAFEDKPNVMAGLLYDFNESVLVFTRTRHGARKLAKTIRDMGHTAAEIHSDRTLRQRLEALNGFKAGLYRILVATDIAARGIDVKGISLVVNYDVPEHAEDYIHRIGRTGRAGLEGRAITLALRQQVREVRDIERLLGVDLLVSKRSTTDSPVLHRPKHFSRVERESANGEAPRPHTRPPQVRRNSGRPPVQREERTEFRPRTEDSAPRADVEPRKPRSAKPFERAPGADRGRFQKPERPGPRSFHARRSDGQQPTWGDKKPAPLNDKPRDKRSFSDKVSEVPKDVVQRDFSKPKPGWKNAKTTGRSNQPHAGRPPAKKSNDSAAGPHQAPAGRTGHRGWSGRPKARRFK